MLQDMSKVKEVNLLDSSDVLIDPATNQKLDELKTLLQDIESNTDELELSAENVNLNVDDLEEISTEIRDTIGQETGSTVLSKLQALWDKLVDLFTNGTAKLKLWDGTNQATITTDNRLRVEAHLEQGTGIENVVQIEDGLGSGYRVKVDESNRFWVATPPPSAPPNTTAVIHTGYSPVSGQVDDIYVIPDGVTLTIQRLSGGAEQDTSFGSGIELWYDPAGTGIGMTIIDVIMANGTSDQHDLNSIYIGNGTRTIRMRRIRFSGGSKWIFGRWEGYY
jgi:hypothetical protein